MNTAESEVILTIQKVLRQPSANQSSSPSSPSSPLSFLLSSSITLSLFYSTLKLKQFFSTIDSHTHQPGYFSDRNLAVLVSYLLNSQQFLFSFSFHLFVARDAFVRTNRRAINCHDAHPSVSLFVCLVRACIVIIGAFWRGSNFLVG